MPALLFDLDGTLVDQLAAGRKNGLGVGLLSGGYGPHELEGAGASASIKIRQICRHTLRTWEFQGSSWEPQNGSEQCQRGAVLALHLLHSTISRRLLRPPAQELCSMTKASAGEVIKLHFNDEAWFDRLPFRGALCAPTAQATGRLAGETWGLD